MKARTAAPGLRARLLSVLCCLLFFTPFAAGASHRDEPSYILSLSWSPTFCSQSGHENNAECRSNRGFIVHGLWPEGSDPASCDQQTRVSDATIQRMLPIMGSRSLVIHEWHKHGACSGQSPQDYFKTIETLWTRLKIPEPYAVPAGSFTTTADRLRQDFVQANPSLVQDDIAPVCHSGALQEIRLCLDDRFTASACASHRASCSGSIIVPALAR